MVYVLCDPINLSSSVCFSWVLEELLAQFDFLPSLRQQCYVFLRHATLSKMVALNMAAMELTVLAVYSCVLVRVF